VLPINRFRKEEKRKKLTKKINRKKRNAMHPSQVQINETGMQLALAPVPTDKINPLKICK